VIQLGVIHLDRTGAHIVRRLLADGHPCVVYDRSPRIVAELAAERAHGAASVPDLVHELDPPRIIWLAGPAPDTESTLAELRLYVQRDDVVVDCGNSDYTDDIRRAAMLAAAGVHYVDVGICGTMGCPGQTYCLTIGGEDGAVRFLEPFLQVIAPPRGYLHCGPSGSGHFVTMIHNGIERRLSAAYTEGFGLLCGAGSSWTEHGSGFDFQVPAIVDVWRHGAPVASPLMERAACEQAAALEAGRGLPELHR
jgi:6-phosphogluconate dehydrogenase